MKLRFTLMAALLVTGCSSMDLQGNDPKEYYAQNPKVNKVESRTATNVVHFAPSASRLTNDERDKLRANLNDVSPAASQNVRIEFAPRQLRNEARRTHLRKFMRSLGYGGDMTFEAADTLGADEARITVQYAVAVLPDCPDWRKSPVTTYSNTGQGNFGCATAVNLGLMVADPRDLVHGSGQNGPDPERSNRVIEEYRSGKDYSTSAQGGSSSAAEAPASGGASGQ